MKNKIYLIENDCTAKKICEEGLYKKNNDIIVCLNYLPAYIFKSHGIKDIFMPDEILNSDNFKGIHNITDKIAKSWFINQKKDLSIFNGVSTGKILSIIFDRTYLCGIIVFYTQIIKKICENHENIKFLTHDLSNNHNYFHLPNEKNKFFFNKVDLIEKSLKQLSLEISYLKPISPIPSEHISPNEIPLSNFSFLKKYFKKCIIKLSSISFLFRFKHKSSLYLDYTYYFNSIINNIDKNVNKNIKISDYPLKNFYDLFKIIFSSFEITNHTDIKLNKKSFFYNDTGLDKLIINKIKDKFFFYNGIDYSHLYVPIIQNILKDKFKTIRYESLQISEFLKKNKIKKVLINNTRSEYSKNIICTAKTMNVKTIFVDHGIQGHKHIKSVVDYTPPDIYIGAGSYKNYKINSEFKILGNPSLDKFTYLNRKRVTKISKILMLSFGDNFYARFDRFFYQEKYISIIFDTAKKLLNKGKYQISYKSHFSNRNYNKYIANFFGVSDLINFVDDKRFEDLIKDYDLLVTSVSTCFYQCIAAGIPVIFVEPKIINNSLNKPFSGKNWDEIIRVSGSEELLDIILRNSEEPKELNNFLDNFHLNHSKKYLGELDGNSSKRIFKCMLEL